MQALATSHRRIGLSIHRRVPSSLGRFCAYTKPQKGLSFHRSIASFRLAVAHNSTLSNPSDQIDLLTLHSLDLHHSSSWYVPGPLSQREKMPKHQVGLTMPGQQQDIKVYADPTLLRNRECDRSGGANIFTAVSVPSGACTRCVPQ